jgi:hypothetical protein
MFKLVLESSRLPLTIPQAFLISGGNGARGDSWRCCLVMSLLDGGVFPHGVMRWMG